MTGRGQPQAPPKTPLQAFMAAVITKAGDPHQVALDLEELGYVGRDGAYGERSVRTWRAGTRTPGVDIVFALARHYGVSMDAYARPQAEAPPAVAEEQRPATADVDRAGALAALAEIEADYCRMRAALEQVLAIEVVSPGQMAQDIRAAQEAARAALGGPVEQAQEATS